MRAAIAGLIYFSLTFVAGFVLGTLRTLVLVPWLGHGVLPVLIELPVILAISWMVCRWTVANLAVPPILSARLAMGAVAFALLMVAEFGLAQLAFGRSLADHVQQLVEPAGLVGLASQIMFAAFPIVQMFTSEREHR